MAIYAVKANKEVAITETEKESYLSAGYDIIEDGKRTNSPSKQISYSEYEKLYEQAEKLKAENKTLKAEVKELKK